MFERTKARLSRERTVRFARNLHHFVRISTSNIMPKTETGGTDSSNCEEAKAERTLIVALKFHFRTTYRPRVCSAPAAPADTGTTPS